MDETLVPKFLALALLLLAVVVYQLYNKQFTISIKLPILLLFAFSIWQFISTLWAVNTAEALFTSGSFFQLPVIIMTTIVMLQKEKNRKFLLIAVLIAGLLLCLYGWQSYFALDNFKILNTLYTIHGFSGFKNLYSIMLFFNVVFSAFAFVYWQSKVKWLIFNALLLNVILIIVLLGRATFIGLIISIFSFGTLFLIFSFKKLSSKLKRLFTISAGSILILFIVVNVLFDKQIIDRYNVANFSSSYTGKERISLWTNTAKLIKDKPVLGVGAGNWHIMFPSTNISSISRMAVQLKGAQRPHNDYLWILSETGIIGLLLYLSFIISIIYLAIYSIIKTESEKNKLILSILLSGFIGYLVIAFFDFPKERIDINVMLGFLIAFMLTYCIQSKLEISIKPTLSKIFSLLVIIILIFNVCLAYMRFTGEQYSKILVADFKAEKHNNLVSLGNKADSFFYTIDPILNPINFYKGYGAYKTKQYEKSVFYYEESLKYSPYHFNTLSFLGITYGRMGEFAKAVPYYEKAMAINEINLQTIEGLAICYYNSNMKDKAIALITGLETKNASILKIKENHNIK